MAKSFTQLQYLAALERAGWLAALPAAARRELASAVAKQFRVARATKLSSIDLFHRLAVTNLDMEMIEATGPKDPCSYHSAIRQLAKHSFGHFAPTKIHDELDPKAQKARVSFELRGRAFKLVVPWQSDWFDGRIIDKLINGTLAATGVAHRFHALPPVDQCVALAFVPDVVWRKATASRVFPKPHEVMDF